MTDERTIGESFQIGWVLTDSSGEAVNADSLPTVERIFKNRVVTSETATVTNQTASETGSYALTFTPSSPNDGDFYEIYVESLISSSAKPNKFQVIFRSDKATTPLPSFTQVSDAGLGNTAIDTGKKVPTEGIIICRFVHVQTGATQALIGVTENSSAEKFTLYVSSDDSIRFNYLGNSPLLTGEVLEDGKEYFVELNWTTSNATMTVNGTTTGPTAASGTLPTSENVYLGGRNTNGSAALTLSGLLEMLVMTDSNDRIVVDSVSHASKRFDIVGKEIDLWVTAGQSNAAGRGSTTSSETPTAGTAFDFNWSNFTDGNLADSVGTSPNNAQNGSWNPSFFKTWHELTGRTSAWVGVAVGNTGQTATAAGSASLSWDASGDIYEAAVAKIHKAIGYYRHLGYQVNFRGILWGQGEKDADAINDSNITKADYKTAFQAMIARFRTEFGPIAFVIARTYLRTGDPAAGFEDVQEAQDETATELEHVVMGYSGTPTLVDTVHYDTASLDTIGAALANAAFAGNLDSALYLAQPTNPSGNTSPPIQSTTINAVRPITEARLTKLDVTGTLANTTNADDFKASGGDATLAKQNEILGLVASGATIQTPVPTATTLQLIDGDTYDGSSSPKLSWTVSKDYTGNTIKLVVTSCGGATTYLTATGAVESSTLVTVSTDAVFSPALTYPTGCLPVAQVEFALVSIDGEDDEETIARGRCYVYQRGSVA